MTPKGLRSSPRSVAAWSRSGASPVMNAFPFRKCSRRAGWKKIPLEKNKLVKLVSCLFAVPIGSVIDEGLGRRHALITAQPLSV